jgi:intein-encoded DNA endonuclease-like protein
MIRKKWSKEKVKSELNEIIKKIKHIPTKDELYKLGRYDLTEACRRYFGSYGNALKAIGLRPRKCKWYPWTKEEVIIELKNLYKKLGHSPTLSEIPGSLANNCRKFFGSVVRAKKEIDIPISDHYHEKIKLPKSAKKLSFSLGYIIGVCLSDGYISPLYKTIRLGVIDKDFADYFAEQLRKWLGINPILRKKEGWWQKFPNGKKYFCKPVYMVDLNSSEATKFLIEKIKNINWIYSSPIEFKRGVLKGLFDGDGLICKNNNQIGFDNSNIKIIELFENLCHNFNIKTRRYKMKENDYRVLLSSVRDKVIFYEKIGITIKRKEDKIKDFILKHQKRAKAYRIVKNLVKKGLSDNEIYRKLNSLKLSVPKRTIFNWTKKNIKPSILR